MIKNKSNLKQNICENSKFQTTPFNAGQILNKVDTNNIINNLNFSSGSGINLNNPIIQINIFNSNPTSTSPETLLDCINSNLKELKLKDKDEIRIRSEIKVIKEELSDTTLNKSKIVKRLELIRDIITKGSKISSAINKINSMISLIFSILCL